jgi:hypothetical protein
VVDVSHERPHASGTSSPGEGRGDRQQRRRIDAAAHRDEHRSVVSDAAGFQTAFDEIGQGGSRGGELDVVSIDS